MKKVVILPPSQFVLHQHAKLLQKALPPKPPKGKPLSSSVRTRTAHRTTPSEYKGVERWGDPKNKRYPLNSKERADAAWKYIHMPRNAKVYSPSELKTVKARIARAARKFGIDISEPKKGKE